jgi:hypothetical protein
MRRDAEASAVEDGKNALDHLFSEIESLREIVSQLQGDLEKADNRTYAAEGERDDALAEVARLKETAFAEIVREVATERMGV